MSKNTLVYRLSADNKRLQKDLAKAQRHLKKFQGQSKSISAGINKSMVGMFSVFSAGIIARDIFQTVTGFEKQMDKVQAISGSTAKEMERLSASAIEIGRASKFTANEIGQLQEELARLGFTSNQITASTDAIRKLATAADAELGESAKTVAATINAFNLSAEQSGEVANIMAESFAKSALSLEKFSVGMSNVGAAANAAGYDMAQTTAMLGVLNDAGIDASKAGTDLRTIFIELAAKGMSVGQAYETILNSQDKLTTAVDLFGKRAANSAIILAENQEKLKGLTGELSDANMELDTMVGIMEDNLITDLQKLKSAWDGFILSLENGEGSGVKALRSITDWITKLLNAMSGNGKAQADLKGFGEEFEKGAQSAKLFTENIKGAVDEQQQLAKWAEIHKKEFGETATIAEYWESKGFLTTIKDRQKELAAETEEANKAFEDLNKNFEEFLNKEEKASEKKDIFSTTQNLTTRGVNLEAPVNGGIQLSNNTEFFENWTMDIETKYADFIARMSTLNADLNATMQSTLQNAIAGFAESLATDGLAGAFQNLNQVLGNGMQQIGKLMIAYGVGLEGLKASLKSLNPALAIGAGAALVAAGAAIKNASSNLSGSIGGGGSGSAGSGRGGRGGSFQGNLQSQSVKLEFEKLPVRGADIEYILKQKSKGNSRLQG